MRTSRLHASLRPFALAAGLAVACGSSWLLTRAAAAAPPEAHRETQLVRAPRRAAAERPRPHRAQRLSRPGRRRLGQRLRPFKNTDIIVQGGISVGPPGAMFNSEIGVVLRGRQSEKPQGVYWENGPQLGPFGARAALSPARELRGLAYHVGPIGRAHPIKGDSVAVPILPGVLSVAAAREGGLGIGLSLPIPGLSYLLFRIPIFIYVSNPRLAGVATKINDGIDWLLRKGRSMAARLTTPLEPAVAKIRPQLVRLGRALERHISALGRKRKPTGRSPAARARAQR